MLIVYGDDPDELPSVNVAWVGAIIANVLIRKIPIANAAANFRLKNCTIDRPTGTFTIYKTLYVETRYTEKNEDTPKSSRALLLESNGDSSYRSFRSSSNHSRVAAIAKLSAPLNV